MYDTKSSHKSAPRRVRQQEQHSFPSARERRRYISSGCEFYLAFLYRRHLAIPVSFIFLQKNCLPSREDGTSGQVENRRVLLFFCLFFKTEHPEFVSPIRRKREPLLLGPWWRSGPSLGISLWPRPQHTPCAFSFCVLFLGGRKKISKAVSESVRGSLSDSREIAGEGREVGNAGSVVLSR